MSKKIKPIGFCPKCASDQLIKLGFTTNPVPKQRYRCLSCEYTTTRPTSKPNPETEVVPMRKKLPDAKRYIITSAQNATPVHKGFWSALQHAAKFYDAELGVIPGRYKNPTSIWTKNNVANEWWASEVVPFLIEGRPKLNERLMILGDLKVQWATGSPLSSKDTLTQDRSGIVGHGIRALRSIATPQHKHPKIMVTTGACTVENYTDSNRGAVAKFNHCFGALIVEIDGDVFYMRELNAKKDGSFIDLDVEFTPEGVQPAERAVSLTMGDTHCRFIQPHVVKATFDAPDSMAKLMNFKHYIWNDVVDFHSRNHHHDDDWATNYAKWKEGKECVRTEVKEAIAFVNKKTPKDAESEIISSNHDRAMDKWIKKADFKKDPVNLDFYLETALAVARSARMTSGGATHDDPFIMYGETLAAPNVRFIRLGKSHMLMGVEHGFHGDLGPNGARGSTKNLSRIGVKVSKGHAHAAEIIDGCYGAGTSAGQLEYEVGGPSNHSNSHIVLYANGKRSLLFIINGRYCLKRPPLPRARPKKK